MSARKKKRYLVDVIWMDPADNIKDEQEIEVEAINKLEANELAIEELMASQAPGGIVIAITERT